MGPKLNTVAFIGLKGVLGRDSFSKTVVWMNRKGIHAMFGLRTFRGSEIDFSNFVELLTGLKALNSRSFADHVLMKNSCRAE